MKNLLFAALLSLLGTPLLYAQQDTTFTTVKVETGTIEPQHYETQYDQAFGTRIPAKWMFKWDIAKLVPVEYYGNRSLIDQEFQLKVGAERKITESLSLGADYTFIKGPTLRLPDRTEFDVGHQLQTNLRWYYNMAKKIREGKGANNFSGNYLSLQSSIATNNQASPNTQMQFTARYGIQRRLLKRSYIDLSYSLGAIFEPSYGFFSTTGTWKFVTNQQFAIGLAHFAPKKNAQPKGGFCDVLRCFDEDKRMLKIDLLNVFQVSELSKRATAVSFLPTIALEQKLGTSPFSAELGIGGQYFYSKFDLFRDGNFNTYRLIGGSVEGELRWYYNLHRRILNGKSGNNLSGPFLAINAGHQRSFWENQYPILENGTISSYDDYTTQQKSATAKVAWGFQQRIFDNAFVQFKAGVFNTWLDRQNKDADPSTPVFSGKYTYRSYFTEVKVGLAF